jgi:hypothetical protein
VNEETQGEPISYCDVIKSSTKKNRVNALEFESGRNFMTGKTVAEMNQST